MKKVEFTRHGELITYRIAEAFMVDGYRVLVDKEFSKETTSFTADDGRSDRVFKTYEEAEKRVLEHVNKLLKYGELKSFTVY